MSKSNTLADSIVTALAGHGVQRMFGIPGGGSSLDLIDAARDHGIDFVLARTEVAAALMAAVTGELTGAPGVVLAGVGPGAASSVNGIAYAHLERAPLLLFTDGPAASLHQSFDQNALFAPISKFQGRLRPADGCAAIEAAIEVAVAPPWGPVHLDLTATDALTQVAGSDMRSSKSSSDAAATINDEAGDVELARELLAGCSRPVIIAGLESRYGDAPAALRKLADALACPVLSTYKAKGVLPDSHLGTVGTFTGAVGESESFDGADLIVLYGLDPVELIPQPWHYDAPILDIFPHSCSETPASPVVRVIGPLAEVVCKVLPAATQSVWTQGEIARLRERARARLRYSGDGHTTQSVVELAGQVAPSSCRATVDAGAHMFSALSSWQAQEPFGVLKSNGLSTMGYALPAAIASCLEEPDRPVVAFTGDGGLMMCLGELKTAVEHNCRLVIVVLNDSALSLIDIKQQRQQRASAGVRYPSTDFAGIAQALGCPSWQVDSHDDLTPAMTAAFAHAGPALIDVTVDSSGYGDQLAALRG